MLSFQWTGPLVAEAQVSPSLPFFNGHFPGNPVLPAVTIIEISRDFLSEAGKVVFKKLEVSNARFSRPIKPGLKVKLEATEERAGWQVKWKDLETEEELVLVVLTG